MKKEFSILAIFFIFAVTPLAIYFSQQQQTTQQRANEPVPTVEVPTVVPTDTPFPTEVPTPTHSTSSGPTAGPTSKTPFVPTGTPQ